MKKNTMKAHQQLAESILNICSENGLTTAEFITVVRDLYMTTSVGLLHTIGTNEELKEEFFKFHCDMVDEILKGAQATQNEWTQATAQILRGDIHAN